MNPAIHRRRQLATTALPWILLVLVAALHSPARAQEAAFDPADWPMYNHDVAGWRFNPVEREIRPDNVAGLVEQWRYPPRDSEEKIGVVHATPAVVAGEVYFGTVTAPACYKLSPDGELVWKYAIAPRKAGPREVEGRIINMAAPQGVFASALVWGDAVYFADAAGFIYSLDRETGEEQWKVDTQDDGFPGAHPANVIFASPIVADSHVIIAGGGYEHALGAMPDYPCCTGRGFVMALEPASGRIAWKYDVGPPPQKLDPPVTIHDDWGEHVFHYGPSTSSVWSTPSYDAGRGLIFFGTDTHNAPRQPTDDDPRLYTEHSCAVIAVDAKTGAERWVRQLNPDDVWNYSLRAYDPKTGLYKDQSIGDTPKLYTAQFDGRPVDVVGVGCKSGGFYVIEAETGELLDHTPLYKGPPSESPEDLNPRTLALPSAIGGLQTGCATDGRRVYANGIDFPLLAVSPDARSAQRTDRAPTGGRVTAISLDTRREHWRHERPKVAEVRGPIGGVAHRDVGDPVASGIALAGGVAFFTTTVSNRLVALDAATGQLLKEIELGPVWSGPSVSRGRVYVGAGNILFKSAPIGGGDTYFPKGFTGAVYAFGLEKSADGD